MSLSHDDRIEARIEAQRTRIFQAQAICGVAAVAAERGTDPIDGKLTQTQACDLYLSLRLVRDLLDEIAGQLDPAVLLDAQPTSDEETSADSALVTTGDEDDDGVPSREPSSEAIDMAKRILALPADAKARVLAQIEDAS
jgi:hypothetical protein